MRTNRWFFGGLFLSRKVVAGTNCGRGLRKVNMTSTVIRKDLLEAVLDSDKSVSNVKIQETTLQPGAKAPLHLHPCPTVGVITEGRITFQMEGKKEQYLKAGDAFYEPAGARVAKFDNEGSSPAKFTVFYLLGRGDTESVRVLDK